MARDKGFDDFSSPYLWAPTLDDYVALEAQVLKAYGFACAVTGVAIPSSINGPDGLFAIVPREHGGPLHVGNYIPMRGDIGSAFGERHIRIADDFSLLVDWAVLTPAILGSVTPRLRLPEDPFYWPDLQLLAMHRDGVLG